MTPSVLVKARELYESGLTFAEVAERVGSSASALCRAFRFAGIPRRPPGHASPDLEMRARARTLYESGLTTREVAAKLHRSTGSARHVLEHSGVTFRAKGRRR